jgi:hypothetical protein
MDAPDAEAVFGIFDYTSLMQPPEFSSRAENCIISTVMYPT